MSARGRGRIALLLLATVPLAAAASLPSTAPGWLFWGCAALACAAAAAWAHGEASRPEEPAD